jgi:hypothetical protein
MQTFKGTLQSTTSRDAPLLVSLQVDGDRIRMWSDRHRIGSWDKHEVKIRRDTIFRFSIEIDEEIYLFTPEDPAALTNAVDVEIDLTSIEKPRFGLADRIRQAADAG